VAAVRTVLVLGGTGQTGRLLVRQALDRGMGVHAVVRDVRRLPIISDRLTVVTGTPVDDAAVRAAMTGCHAVLSALGVSRTSAWPWAATTSPPDFMASSIATTVGVMKDLGLTRIVVVSAGGVGDSVGDMPPLFPWLVDHSRIGDAYRGHEDQERLLRQSGLDWTALRPSMLSNQPRSGQVVLSYGGRPRPRRSISRDALAVTMLDALDDASLVGKAPTVSQT
jgi:putative NADH-flavin reductase